MSRSITKKESSTKLDSFAQALATGLGAGFSPVAPGTVGSLEGVALFLAIRALELGLAATVFALAVVNLLVFIGGVWASSRTCKAIGLEDPGQVVIDEVSGQLLALSPLILLPSLSITSVVLGFLLFRLFDIFKPYPIRKLERLPGGFGVMADDVLAGIYAAVSLYVTHFAGWI